MLSIEWLVAIGVGLFALGGLVGFLLRASAFGGSRKEADLAAALEESEKALADYKQEVLERFSDTAEKFRRLNESYSDLHQQLAESAVALCGDEITTPLLEARTSVMEEGEPARAASDDTSDNANTVGPGTEESNAEEPAADVGDDDVESTDTSLGGPIEEYLEAAEPELSEEALESETEPGTESLGKTEPEKSAVDRSRSS